MKKIAIITPVPQVIETLIKNSMLRKAVENQVVDFSIIDLRNFGIGNYRQIDDSPYGGGSGMIMMAEPLIKAIESGMDFVGHCSNLKVIFPSPQGISWDQKTAEDFSKWDRVLIICGHYKGIDERIIKKYVTNQFSIGDFIMTSGEIPAIIMLDSALRLVPGTLNNIDSALTDTFALGLLDYPHYTNPRIVKEMSVPDVLISGHHKNIASWRKNQREKRTKDKRPDLWKKYLKQAELEKNNE